MERTAANETGSALLGEGAARHLGVWILERSVRNGSIQRSRAAALACPAECSYCFGPDNGPSMSAETMDAALDFMARIVGETNQKKVKVTFHGGEPLMAGHALWDRALEGLETRFWLPEMRSGRAEQPVASR